MSLPIASFLQDTDFIRACYILAFAMFIYGVRLGTHPSTARRGNGIAAAGMALAVVATLLTEGVDNWALIAIGLAVGTAISIPAARNVKMTAMPQMVALFNGLGGGAVALIAWAEFRDFSITQGGAPVPLEIMVPVLISAVIGSISFWGSNIAFAKLQELISGRPIGIPGQTYVNGLLLAGIIAACIALAIDHESPSETLFIAMLIAAALLGNMFVLPIGGADMPVVISLLNAFTGLSAAAAGFSLDNVALIVAGTLVGSSGTILTLLMAEAMNRSVSNVLFSGFGGTVTAIGSGEERPHKSTSAGDAAIQMAYASQVIVVPGYGMAVAQAQHAVKEMAAALEKKGVDVLYAIHPVAGRMPGHMNVLLAEADVPYESLKEMEEINPEFPRTDVALVIGANDVTNPAANDDENSPIYGMPILNVHEAQSTIVIKRSMNPGFAGIDNDLYYREKTQMLFGDAKSAVAEIVSELDRL